MIRQPPSVRKPPGEVSRTSSPVEQQVAILSAQLDILRAQVRQAQQVASLGAMAATIAHEVNNLLTPILAYADSALKSDDPAFAKKALEVTVRNSRMLIAMSERMLELGAAKTQQPEKTDLRLAVSDALAGMCRDVEKDGISFTMHINEDLCVLADPLQLRQVFFNLFSNAREAMAGGHSGRLTVTAIRQEGNEATRQRGPNDAIGDHERKIDNFVTIEVRNSGPVIPADLLPNIFEPFQSSKPAMRNGKLRCSGLGLALVRDLVIENNGTIEVTSTEASGTTFRLTLPLAD